MELLAHAPTEAAMWTFLKARGWAASNRETGNHPTEGVQISIIGEVPLVAPELDEDGNVTKEGTKATGVHFNLRFSGDKAAEVQKFRTKIQQDDTEREVWDMEALSGDLAKSLKSSLTQKTKTAGNVKAGWECSKTGVRIFDAVTVGTRYNEWA